MFCCTNATSIIIIEACIGTSTSTSSSSLSANMRTQEISMHVLMTKSRFGVISNFTHHPSSSPSPNACHGRMAGNAHQLVHIYSINISIPSRYRIFIVITFCLHPLSQYIDDATFSHNILIPQSPTDTDTSSILRNDLSIKKEIICPITLWEDFLIARTKRWVFAIANA